MYYKVWLKNGMILMVKPTKQEVLDMGAILKDEIIWVDKVFQVMVAPTPQGVINFNSEIDGVERGFIKMSEISMLVELNEEASEQVDNKESDTPRITPAQGFPGVHRR